jgi:hypothetical protein
MVHHKNPYSLPGFEPGTTIFVVYDEPAVKIRVIIKNSLSSFSMDVVKVD